MKKIAYLFPGQGSQKVGMGRDLYEASDAAKTIFTQADEVSGLPVSRLCFEGPMEELTQTVNLQPAITAVNLACLAVIDQTDLVPDYCAGHSLGEYSALNAADVVSAENTIKLVNQRGQLMHRESLKNKGAMHAIVGLPIAEVEALVAEVQPQGIVSVANHNSELQIVVTGSPESVEQVSALASQKGAKAIPLNVSGAWHSELIKGAEEELNAILSEIDFHPPEKTLVLNVTGEMATESDEIKAGMQRQLCNPVKWYDAMNTLIQQKIDTFVEVGPGRVLAGLLKKTIPPDYPAKIYNVSNMKQLEKLLHEIV